MLRRAGPKARADLPLAEGAELEEGERSAPDLTSTAPHPVTRPALTPESFEREPDRFELKYWIPEALTHKIVAYLSPYLVLEPFAAKMGLTQQVNTSLYLETPGLDAYRTHIDEAADRYKLRVRAYGDPPRGITFFEVKRKINTRCVKTRTAVPMDHMKALLEGTYQSLPPWLKPSERRHLEMFLYAQQVTQARPFLLVRATREPYCSEDPLEDVRVTIDRSICFQKAQGPNFSCDPDAWTPLDGEEQHGMQGPHALVELKFPGIAPFWMKKLVERLDIERVAYSKYISSVRHLLEQNAQDASDWDASGV